jgi:hypothetical protein
VLDKLVLAIKIHTVGQTSSQVILLQFQVLDFVGNGGFDALCRRSGFLCLASGEFSGGSLLKISFFRLKL